MNQDVLDGAPGYVLVPRRWWLPFGRKEWLWDRMPEGNSPARGWLISERLMREIEDETNG